jgi:hypothetical protein
MKTKQERRDAFACAVAPKLLREAISGMDWDAWAKKVFGAADALLKESELRAKKDK